MANIVSSVGSIKRSDFTYKPDEEFVFGSATAAYQIEGGAFEGGKGLSIWDAYTLNTPGNIADGSNGNVAVNHYRMSKEDVYLMKKTGFKAYRFSISWARILPGGKLCTGVNQDGIKFYNDLIDNLLEGGITPYVTLFHWDLPYTLELEYGGFLSDKIVEHFNDYAELCFWEFGDRVKNWITTNEAWTYVWKGYVNGQFPPGRGSNLPSDIQLHAFDSLRNRSLSAVTDLIGAVPMQTLNEIDHLTRTLIPSWMKDTGSKFGMDHIEDFITNKVSDVLKDKAPKVVDFIKDALISLQVTYKSGTGAHVCPAGNAGTEPYIAAHHIILAHARAVKTYREKFQGHQKGEIGMTNNINYYVPYDETKQEDIEAADRAKDFMLYWFVEPLVTGEYPESMRKRVGKNLPTFTPEQKEMVKGSYDFLGINYYTTYYAMNMPKYPNSPGHYDLDQEAQTTPMKNGQPIGTKCGSPWLYSYPEGIYLAMTEITKKFKDANGKSPVICITENGADEELNKGHTIAEARDDQTRLNYHNDHLWYMKKALDEGVKCKGYFIWSFMDNYEWAEGYGVRFGIFYVDFVNGRYTRHPKSSALWWTRFMHDTQALVVPEVAKKAKETSSKRLITNGEEGKHGKKHKTGLLNPFGL